MSETVFKNIEKTEGVRPWKKCMWRRYRLEQGNYVLEEGTHSFAILLVIKGVLRFFGKPGEDSFLIEGQSLCLLSATPPYQITVQEDVHFLICMFHVDIFPFDREMLNSLLPFYKRDEGDHIVIKTNEVVNAFMMVMDEYIERRLEGDLLFDIKRQELFLLLFTTYSKNELAAFFYPLIGEGLQFKEFVISNYIKAKNVQQLAQMANYSTSGFIKKFIKYFNESPYQWMLRHKAKIILDEICSSQTTLKEIAFKYNFSTYQYFVDFCKMQFGAAPSKLR